MKKNIIRSIIVIILIIIILIGVKFISTINKPLKVNNDEIITVAEGESFYNILDKLKEENKIKNTFFIKIYMKLSNVEAEVHQGEHIVNKDVTLKQLISTLKDDKVGGVSFTVPEGYNIEDIADILQKEGICTVDEFLNTIENYPLPSYVTVNPAKRYALEGYLFPDTYKINKEVTVEEIVEMMLYRFEDMWQKAISESNIKVDEADIEKVITIASMIENEATLDEERSKISSVIYNRIDADMPLQIDATVIYALGYHVEQVLYSHLEVDSPYNTYLYSGLPIGPICNPGYKSIVAALNPDETDYLYYLVESEGKHYFTNNHDDFESKKEELGY